MARLIVEGWDPTLQDSRGETPADYTRACNDTELSSCQAVQEILGKPTQVLTKEQMDVLMKGNLDAIKEMVPSRVNPNAKVTLNAFPSSMTLLPVVIMHHKCTDEGHAIIQYLIEEGANPKVEAVKVRLNEKISMPS